MVRHSGVPSAVVWTVRRWCLDCAADIKYCLIMFYIFKKSGFQYFVGNYFLVYHMHSELSVTIMPIIRPWGAAIGRSNARLFAVDYFVVIHERNTPVTWLLINHRGVSGRACALVASSVSSLSIRGVIGCQVWLLWTVVKSEFFRQRRCDKGCAGNESRACRIQNDLAIQKRGRLRVVT